jgi:hypothetical protein
VEQQTEAQHPSPSPDERAYIESEAVRMGLEGDDRKIWMLATPKQRALFKARKHRDLKRQAREKGINPEHFVQMSPEERKQALAEAEARAPKSIDDVASRVAERAAPAPVDPRQAALPFEADGDDEEARAPGVSVADDGEEVPVVTAQDAVPQNDMRPGMRRAITIGNIDDLYGDRPPKNLPDVYARWPIGRPGGEGYYIRVERVLPKRHMNFATAGYLGDMRWKLNEAQFQQYFGGQEYKLQVYGPDPRGRTDTNGDPVIKALTDPFPFYVPKYDPNLQVMPVSVPIGSQQDQRSAMYDPSTQFQAMPGMPVQQQAPLTSADASIVTAALNFAKDSAKKPPEDGNTPPKMFEYMQETASAQVAQARNDAEARERILREKIQEQQNEIGRLAAQVQQALHGINQARESESAVTDRVMQIRHEESTKIHEHYRQEIDSLRAAHDKHLETLLAAHREELARERQRVSETETKYRDQLDLERRRIDDIEKKATAEIQRIRDEERESARQRIDDYSKRADERIKETTTRFEDRVRDTKEQHERELRIQVSNTETKEAGKVTGLSMEITRLKEQLEDRTRERDEARKEAEKGKNPVAILREAEKQAKELGFEKPDKSAAEPEGFLKALGSAAGTGIGQALSKVDLAAVAGMLAGRPMPGAPAGGVGGGHPAMAGQPQARQLPPPGPSRRAMQWAAGGPAGYAPPRLDPNAPPIVNHPAPPPPQQPPQAQQAQPQPQQQASQPPPAPQQGQQPEQAPPQGPPIEHPMIDAFGPQAILGFLQAAEGAINAAVTPDTFATMFVAQYPEQAQKLAASFKAADAIGFVEKLATKFPETEGSAILRNDGRRWMAKLWEVLAKQPGKAS